MEHEVSLLLPYFPSQLLLLSSMEGPNGYTSDFECWYFTAKPLKTHGNGFFVSAVSEQFASMKWVAPVNNSIELGIL